MGARGVSQGMERKFLQCVLPAMLVAMSLAAGPAQGEQAYVKLRIDGQPVKWAAPAAKPSGVTTLTWALADDRSELRTEGAINCGLVTGSEKLLAASRLQRDALQAAAERAFARWQSAAALVIQQAPSAEDADIVIGAQGEPMGYAYTNLVLAEDTQGTHRAIKRATICLNPEKRWKIGFNGDLTEFDLEHTLAHEIGHAIGLDHPGPRGHLMSFRYSETIAGLSAGDREGAAALYGPPTAPNPAFAIVITTTAAMSTVARTLIEQDPR